MTRADTALYRAKEGGRDQAVAWTPALSESSPLTTRDAEGDADEGESA